MVKGLGSNMEEILTRGVSAVYPSRDALEEALNSGKKLRIYTGIDPTGQLHIGHMVVLRKLRQFQDLGHDVIVLIGDFTAQIGDPTDKSAARRKLSPEEVEENSSNYKELIGKILDTGEANIKFLHNDEWTNKLKPIDMLELASHFTVQQLIERDMFQQRIKSGKEIYLHEFLYPIFQAYDAVTMDVDMQIGGNDQTFNMLAGRTLMKKLKDKEKFVLATKLLTDGAGKKMGKTESNFVSLDESPENIFGKVMAYPDEMIEIGFELLTDKNLDEINQNPRDAKAELAYDIVRQLHGESEAKKAQEDFDRRFKNKELPENIEVKNVASSQPLVEILISTGFAPSKSEARRLIEQGAVKINSEPIKDVGYVYKAPGENVLQVGKLKIVKIRIND